MKKTLLFCFAFLFAMATMAQPRAIILQESFDGSSMPAGWSTAGLGTSNWAISPTQNAGGNPNELMLYWSPQFNGTSRIVFPAVDLTGIESVRFLFKHALDNYQGGHTLGIATSSDGGTTWNTGWSQNYASDGVWSVSQVIATSDMGKENVQFSIYYTGNSYNINNWYFDDIDIFVLENLDLGYMSTTVPNIVTCGYVDMGFNVFNYGVETVTSIEASYSISGMETVTETFNVNIASMGTATIEFDTPALLIPGEYHVSFTIDKVNGEGDDIIDNNLGEKNFVVSPVAVARIPMIEHFSSSTCGPCVSVNTQMLNFCNNNPGRFTYTKYQMNWPQPGDPYYTEEGNVRRGYYSVNAVPDVFLDAVETSINQNNFNTEANVPAYMDVRGSFNVEGNTINVKVDVMSYITTQARVYVSVNEKETHNNVGSNGETSFHHVFMKMLPNAQGTTVDFVASELQHLEFTQNMSSTHVEEMSDLEVSIWVQDYGLKEIYNSHFAYEYTDEHPYPVENLTMLSNAAKGTLDVSWDAPSNGNPTGYDVYINGERVLEGTTETSYSFVPEEGEYYVAGVTALYSQSNTSVMTVVLQPEEVVDNGLVAVEGEVALTMNTPSAELHVINANYESETPIEIFSVSEDDNDTGLPYLVITANELPYTLAVGETYSFMIEPNYPLPAKSIAEAIITVESDAGSTQFVVEVEGDLLSVTELSTVTKLYPNPATGNFTVEGANVAKVEVYNLVGQKVFEQQGNKVVNIDVSSWNKGLYLVNITNENGSVETHKLVVK